MLALALTDQQTLPQPSGELERIFREHHGQVFGTAYRVTGSAQDAEDVLQTVFLRLLRRQGELDLSPSPGSYLHRAAVNASLDLLKSRARSGSIPLDELPEPTAEGGDATPERRQRDREIRRSLRQAILSLGPKGAEVFTMRFLDDTPNREIAKTLGMTATAVGVALHRARNQVKQELANLTEGN